MLSRDQAVALRETANIEVGAEQAAPLLVSGFAAPEQSPEASYRWSLGPSSRFRFFVSAPRRLVLHARAHPLPADGAPPQELRLGLNDAPLGALVLRDGWDEVSHELPAAGLRAGWNDLEVTYAYVRSPAGLIPGSTDARQIAVAWERFDFEGACVPEADEPDPDDPATEIVLSACTALDWHLLARPGDRLRLAARSGPIDSTGPLRVEIHRDAAAPLVREIEPASRTALDVDLALAEPSALRVLLLAPPAASPRAVWRLDAPRLVGRVEPPKPRADTPPGSAENLVLYVIDTLRADRVGALGHDGSLTPRIDAFASGAVVFEHAFAQSSWTRTAMASIFTGLNPIAHATLGRYDALPATARTLAEELRERGFETAGFVTNPNVSEAAGFAQGFATYEYLRDPREKFYTRGDALVARALAWLDERSSERPFFLYLHAMDPHDPYDPPEDLRTRLGSGPWPEDLGSTEMVASLGPLADERTRNGVLALYEGEIESADRAFGGLLDGLAARGLSDSTAVALASDHGEELGDHGRFGHGVTLYHEQLAMVLAIRLPNGPAGRYRSAARQVDVAPTLLAAVGLPPWQDVDGRSLLGAPAPGDDEPVFAELRLDGRAVEAVMVGTQKLIRSVGRPGEPTTRVLHDLATDPTETRDLTRERPVTAGWLERLLDLRASAGAPPIEREEIVLDAEMEARLRAVGYLP